MPNGLEHIKKEAKNIKGELWNQTTGLILAAFGLVAGLAWNSAITSFISYFFPVSTSGLIAKFIYAVVLTAVLTFLAYGMKKKS